MTTLPNVAPEATSGAVAKDVNVQNFMAEVIQASLQLPVLVYFTAAWCGPCKQFGPLLEKVVASTKGRVKLVRVDVDKSPQLAQQFRIQSVPMIYVFLQGQPLDGFAGALPESQLRQLIDQIAGAAPADEELQMTLEAAAQMLQEGQAEQAEEVYRAILAQEPENLDAKVGLCKALIALERFDETQQLLDALPQDKQSAESVAAVKAALALAKSAPKAADLAALKKAVAANPKNFDARYELAVALFAGGAKEEAVGELLAIIAASKDWNEGAARTRLLTFFEALGFTDPIAVQGRRKLSSLLFA